MKKKSFSRMKVFLFALAVSASATAYAQVVYCPAGFYCNEIYDECMQTGRLTPLGCKLERDNCYADACS